MNVIAEVVLWGFGVYLVLEFVVAPFVVPHLRRVRIPARIPEDLRKTAMQLSEEHPDDLAFLRAVLDEVKSRYRVSWMQHYRYPRNIFRKDIEKIWNDERGGQQLCHVFSFIIKTMLVASGRFTDEEVTGHATIHHLNIHHYLSVATGRGTVYIDGWGYVGGKLELGEYAFGLGKRGTPIMREEATKGR